MLLGSHSHRQFYDTHTPTFPSSDPQMFLLLTTAETFKTHMPFSHFLSSCLYSPHFQSAAVSPLVIMDN